MGNAPVIRGMLAICFPNPLYKVAEVSQVRLRNVRAEMFQGIELVCHFNKSYPAPAAGLLPRTPRNFVTKPSFDKLQRTVINAPNILARLPNNPMVQPLYSTSMLHKIVETI